jgi:hypothetical protein
MIKIESFLEEFHWETNQDNGYQYCVCLPHNQSEFKNLITYIKKYGYIVKVQGDPYVSVDIGEYLYWTMWSSIEEPNIINRMRINRTGQKRAVLKGMSVKLAHSTCMYLNGLCERIMHPFGRLE